jgi:hypothetical protein
LIVVHNLNDTAGGRWVHRYIIALKTA